MPLEKGFPTPEEAAALSVEALIGQLTPPGQQMMERIRVHILESGGKTFEFTINNTSDIDRCYGMTARDIEILKLLADKAQWGLSIKLRSDSETIVPSDPSEQKFWWEVKMKPKASDILMR